MSTENMYPTEGNPDSGSAPIELKTSRHSLGNDPWDEVLKDIELEHFLKSWNILSTLFRRKIKAMSAPSILSLHAVSHQQVSPPNT